MPILKQQFRYLLIGLSIVLFSSTSQASIDHQWKNERALYKKVISTKKSKRNQAIRSALPKLSGYPLKQYLEFQLITSNFNNKSRTSVIRFQRKYKDSRLSGQLQQAWLKHLHRKKQWLRLQTEYARMPIGSTAFTCMQLDAQLHRGQKSQAYRKVSKLWLSGKSQPKACDPVFASWIKSGKLSSEQALQRFWLAVDARNFSLARYVSKFVKNKKLKQQTVRFWTLYGKPELLYRSVNKSENLHTLKFALAKLAKSEPERAVKYWLKVRKIRQLTLNQRAAIDTALARRMAISPTDKKYALLKRIDKSYQQASINEYRIRIALQRADWNEIYQTSLKLNQNQLNEDIWRYWYAVSTKKTQTDLGKLAKADDALLNLAKKRSYYGYLAATITHQEFQLVADKIALSAKTEDRLARIPAIQRAVELRLLDRNRQSAAEWFSALHKLSDTDQKLATLLASKWEWNFLTINSAAQAGAWDLVEARFPNPYPQLFKKFAKKKSINAYWPIAIARQESAFKPNARSRVGARGLMQLMPRTAKETAKKYKLNYRKLKQLSNPKTNIDLGTSYLAQMIEKFDGNHAFASAAYNAGPHRVSKWLKERGHLPLDAWIETIPFRETRKYVKNVLTYKVIYQRLDRSNSQLMTDQEVATLSIPQLSNRQLAQLESRARQ